MQRQHAVVARWQLLELGLGPDAIDSRIRTGRLHVIHRGVYAVGHSILTQPGTFMAAVLACGEDAVLSHRSAAAHWGILKEGPRWVEVTVPGNGGRKQRFILPHRSVLTPKETQRRHRIPVTSPSRTLLDCADVMTERDLERALDEAHFLRLDLSGLESRPGRAGAGRLKRVLAKHVPGSTRTRTVLEETMLTACRRASLPQPAVNATVQGRERDFTWHEQRLVVETDGWQAHGTHSAFEDDRIRDAELMEEGWTVLRITHDRLATEPAKVAAQLGRILARRS